MPRNTAEKINTETDLDNLCNFVRDIMKNWPDGDVEGDDLENLALKYGMIKLKDPQPRAPCCDECTCRENFDLIEFANGIVKCYERTDLLNAL